MLAEFVEPVGTVVAFLLILAFVSLPGCGRTFTAGIEELGMELLLCSGEFPDCASKPCYVLNTLNSRVLHPNQVNLLY